MKALYRIAGISISVDAPIKIEDTDAFVPYRVLGEKETGNKKKAGKHDKEYTIRLIPDETLPEPCGPMVFQNELNCVYEEGDRCLHYFHIPLSRGIAAWNWILPGNELELHYIPAAESYFRFSTGIFNAAGFERILFACGKYLFHCSYVEYQGRGILFSAPSGGGKTTQGNLWERYAGAEMINGDRAVLEIKGDTCWCHGLPIAGSSGVFTNRSNPLLVIFRVQKAEENRVQKLSGAEAFQAVYSELTTNLWNSAFTLGAVDFAMRLAEKIPVYLLKCRKDKGAVTAAKEIVDQILF